MGARGPKKQNSNSVIGESGIPRIPVWLVDKEEKKLFKSYAKQFNDAGLLNKLNGDSLGVLVRTIRFYLKACDAAAGDILQKGRDGGTVKNPALQIRKDATAELMKVLIEFGLTPSARERVKVITQNKTVGLFDEEPDSDNPDNTEL